MKPVKIVVIGGGSSYTPELADGIIKTYSTFPVKEVVLVDIEEGMKKAEIVCTLLNRMFLKAGLTIYTWATDNRLSALKNADFIISQFRVGGLAARGNDEKIPLKYGVVGQETTGPGGFANALRTIPVALELCRDIETICPDAWLINFTNPSGIITEAIKRYSRVKCIGLCNVPINMEREVCNSLGVDKTRVHCRFAGLNHLSFIGKLFVDGKDLLLERGGSKLINAGIARNMKGVEIPAELIDALGFIPSPYLKYYYLERLMVKEATEKYKASGKTRADEVCDIEEELFKEYADLQLDQKPEKLSERGGALYSEAAVSLMNSIFNDTGDIHVVNTLNRGAIPDLPDDAVVETDCVINSAGASPIVYGHLPKTICGLVCQVKAYERLTIEAAIEGDPAKAVVALANNPLVMDVTVAKCLWYDIYTANAEYLKAFAGRSL